MSTWNFTPVYVHLNNVNVSHLHNEPNVFHWSLISITFPSFNRLVPAMKIFQAETFFHSSQETPGSFNGVVIVQQYTTPFYNSQAILSTLIKSKISATLLYYS